MPAVGRRLAVDQLVTPGPVACTMCSSGRRAVDAMRVGGGELFAVCEECEKADPTYIRRNGSFFRLLGFEVHDIRGLLK
jgi:hypothetical protein